MKAVILAGGLGTRISEETHLKPKPMIEIGGKPILWHIMKMYSHYGINDFIIANTGLLLLLWALSEGPASLVLALAGTRAMFVVLFSTSIALVWNGALGEDTSRRTITIKVGAVVAIVLGAAGVSI